MIPHVTNITYINKYHLKTEKKKQKEKNRGERLCVLPRPAIMNSDNRAVEETEWWEKTFSGRENIFRSLVPVTFHVFFKQDNLVEKNNLGLYNKADKFLSVGDYILTQLGLLPYTDYSLACRTMAFDINKHDWSEEIPAHCDIPKQKLGIPVASGSIAGKLSKEIATELGIK